MESYTPHLLNWEIAYTARELRHNKTVTVSCLHSEVDTMLEQLNSFSRASQIKAKTVNKVNPKEVYLEITEMLN